MQLSRNVLQHFGSLRGLITASQKQFCAVKGIGVTQFIQLQACTEMTRRYLLAELKEEHCFTSSDAVKMYLQTELEGLEREVFFSVVFEYATSFNQAGKPFPRHHQSGHGVSAGDH